MQWCGKEFQNVGNVLHVQIVQANNSVFVF